MFVALSFLYKNIEINLYKMRIEMRCFLLIMIDITRNTQTNQYILGGTKMLTVKSCPLELRGVANKTSKAGKTFHVLNVETHDGTPYALYCRDVSVLPAGLKKGDMVYVTFSVSYYMGNERLTVVGAEKVS